MSKLNIWPFAVFALLLTAAGALAASPTYLGNASYNGVSSDNTTSAVWGFVGNGNAYAYKWNSTFTGIINTVQFYVNATSTGTNYTVSLMNGTDAAPDKLIDTNQAYFTVSASTGYKNATGFHANVAAGNIYWVIFDGRGGSVGQNTFGGIFNGALPNVKLYDSACVGSLNSCTWATPGVGSVAALNVKFFGNTTDITVNITDEATGATVKSTTNSTVTLTGTQQQYSFSMNGSMVLSGLVPDIYSIIVSPPGYFSRAYSVDARTSAQQVNAYVLNSGNATNIQTTFTVTDYTNIPVEGALIISQVLSNSTLNTMETRTTDFAGQAKMSYDSTKFYTITFSKAGYITKSATLQPIQTGYNVRLSKTNTADFLTSFNDITSFGYTPTNTTLAPGSYTFTFSVGSVNSTIRSFTISDDYGNSTSASTAAGGTLSLPLNLQNVTGTYRITYNVSTMNDGDWSYQTIYNLQTYFNASTNTTAGFSIQNFGDYFGNGYVCTPFGEVCRGGAIIMAGLGIVVILVVLGSMMFGAYLGGVAGALILVAASLSFIPWTYAIMSSAILFFATWLGRR